MVLGRWKRTLLSLCLLGAPLGIGAWVGYTAAGSEEVLDHRALTALKERTLKEQQSLTDTKDKAERQLQALTVKMARLQARLVRLDALGERLTEVAKLDKGEFDFSEPPALGGPASEDLGDSYAQPDFVEAMDGLMTRLDDREQQLEILEALLANRKIRDDTFLAGRPIRKGWMSSSFGLRTDPFNGHVAMHKGMDFAGKEGSDIIAVASGVVTWAGDRYGYGKMVEINHGDGYVTRYAHSELVKVKVGDIVKKGQVIALMGSTGRSTGPHVHFEVYKNGRVVDPASYIHRASR